MKNLKATPGENPISTSAEDTLGRGKIARDFAKYIRELDISQGLVAGVLGPWGQGKSSFINLMKEEFAADPATPIVEFNPWLFSGSRPLTEVFFTEIAAELKIADSSKFGNLAKWLDDYGDILSPIALIPWVGGWWDRAINSSKALLNFLETRRQGSSTIRNQISNALLVLEQPIVVVIDDIDRLSSGEIRDIFKLVRLTASFPNILYLLAFDRLRVEQALAEQGVPGRAYLEKIVQVGLDLPAIPKETLRSAILERLNTLLGGLSDVRFNSSDWPSIFYDIVEPLIGNLRDVTRLALSAKYTIEALGKDVETVDLVAIEAIRIFRPEIFHGVCKEKHLLTDAHDVFSSRDISPQKAAFDNLLSEIGDQAGLFTNLVKHVFPMARIYTDNIRYGHDLSAEAKRNHRLAHIDYLDLYLERVESSGFTSFRRSERAFAVMPEIYEFAKFIDDLSTDEIADTIKGLDVFEQNFTLDRIFPGVTVLMNRIHQIPESSNQGLFDLSDPDLIVSRVVLRMLRSVEDEAIRDKLVQDIVPELVSYSSQLALLQLVGYREGVGQKLVSNNVAETLEREFFNRVATNHPGNPKQEWGLTRVYLALSEAMKEKFIPIVLTDPDEIRALLASARITNRSQSIGSYFVTRTVDLSWPTLVRVVGGEDKLSDAVRILRESDGGTELVEIAERHVAAARLIEE